MNYLETDEAVFLPVFGIDTDTKAIAAAEKLFSKPVEPVMIPHLAADGMPHSPETLKIIGMRDLNFGLRAGHALIGHGMDLTPETLGRVMEEFDDNVLFITRGDATGKEQEKRLAAADYESAMRQRDLSMPQKDAIARRRLARERSAEQLVEVYVKDPTANRVLKLPLYPSYPASEGVNYNRTDGLPRLDNFIKTAFVVGDPAYFAQKAIDGKSLVYYNAANLATGGYGALASKMEETYNKSGKAIYRVRDAREYAMLPEEYEALPKKDKEAIQGISDPLDHLTDLMDAYNAAYDHPVEGAQDVEAYYCSVPAMHRPSRRRPWRRNSSGCTRPRARRAYSSPALTSTSTWTVSASI